MYDYRKLSSEQRAKIIEQRLVNGYPPHEPPHLKQDDTCYFLTGVCFEHAPHMKFRERRKEVLDMIFELFTEHGMNILAWVVLLNHYHLLVNVTEFDLLRIIFQKVHGRTAFEWNNEENARGRKVWFRYTDRAMRSERHYYTTLNYIHYNPVKHKLVESPYDWEHSSVHWYLEHYGREWLRDAWAKYPVRQYGEGWDDI